VVLKHSCGVDKEIMNHKQEMIDRDDNLILHFTLKMNSFIHHNRHKRLCKSTYVSFVNNQAPQKNFLNPNKLICLGLSGFNN
jgi:hypothetical protein